MNPQDKVSANSKTPLVESVRTPYDDAVTLAITGPRDDIPSDNMGFRRIEFVRIVVDGQRTTAEVTGVAHRYPRTKRITVSTAARLVASGAPLSFEHRAGTP